MRGQPRAAEWPDEPRIRSIRDSILRQALAELAGDPVLIAQPPASWAAVLALIEQLARQERLLLVLDEIPYWAARDASLPSVLQN